MLVKHIAILFVFSVFVLLPRPSKQEKPEDCVNGKQFWTRHSITDDGACVLCPDHWKNCYNEHIDDQKRCVDSCHTKPKPVTVTVASTPTSLSTTLIPIPTSATPNSTSDPETSFSISNTPTKYPKDWILIVVAVLAFCFIAVMGLLIVRLRRTRQKKDIPLEVVRRDDPENPNNEVEAELLPNADQSQQTQQPNGDFEDPINNGGQVSHEPENDENLFPAIQESRIREETGYNVSTASFLNETES